MRGALIGTVRDIAREGLLKWNAGLRAGNRRHDNKKYKRRRTAKCSLNHEMLSLPKLRENPGSITLAPRRVYVHQCSGVALGTGCNTVQLPATFMSMSRASVPRLANSAMASAAAIATPASA